MPYIDVGHCLKNKSISLFLTYWLFLKKIFDAITPNLTNSWQISVSSTHTEYVEQDSFHCEVTTYCQYLVCGRVVRSNQGKRISHLTCVYISLINMSKTMNTIHEIFPKSWKMEKEINRWPEQRKIWWAVNWGIHHLDLFWKLKQLISKLIINKKTYNHFFIGQKIVSWHKKEK